VLCASAESGRARRACLAAAEEAAETAGIPVEIAAPVLVLIVLGFARRSGDRYEALGALHPMLTDEAMGQLLANLRTTYQQSRELVDRAKRCRDWPVPIAGRSHAAAKAETSADPNVRRRPTATRRTGWADQLAISRAFS
jgi:hypothetical protein